jgi:hypothetical protein
MASKNPRRNIFWPTHVKREGKVVAIRDVLVNKAYLFIAGSAADGWAVYMRPAGDESRAQQVSPLLHRDQGDKLADLRAAAERVYGIKFLNNRANVAKHPAENWIWQTVEAPEARAERVEKKAASIVFAAKDRFGADITGMLEWLETERVQHCYIEANSGNWIVRDEEGFLAEATALAIIRIRDVPADVATQEAAQARDMSASDDIAFWTLEATKRPGVPLWNNLDIPADVAEDIDAANWTVGSGIKDASGRREIFRKRRAEAYAAMYPDHAAELAAEKAAQVEPFDAAKVKITRKRFSATQGEVLVEYDGRRIEQYGDNIKLAETGAWEGLTDAHWIAIAEREAVKRGLAAEPAAAPSIAHYHRELRRGARIERLEVENAELRAENERLKLENAALSLSLEQTERLPAPPVSRSTRTTVHPIAKGGANPVFTVTGREADGHGGERMVDADFSTRAEAEAYRAEREQEGPGRLVGMFLERNKAAVAADEAAGAKPNYFGWCDIYPF